jgi:hypothetical protein
MTPEKIVWAKRNTKRAITPLLLARRISNEWLETSFETIEVRFQGKLLAAMVDLRDAAKQLKPVKNLPIGSLRLMLQAGINGLISVEKNLGCDTDKGLPAITLYASEETDAAIANSICEQLARWHMNVLEPWAQRQGDGLGGLAARVGKVIAADGILLARSELRLRPRADRPNFSMIVRRIADQLAGESLFPGMGPCELVLPEYGNVSTLELMTPPRRSARDNSSFSMVARIVVSTVPYSADLYLTISAAKRVWAEKMPTGGNTGDRATAYVMIPGCPSMPVAVVRQKDDGVWKWDFDDDYAAIFNESKQELAATLDKALASVAYADDRWWVGLPQTTRLYSRIASRTVFEGDEKDLLDAVEPCLAGILDGEVNFVSHRVSLNGKPASTMLRAEGPGGRGHGNRG